MTDREIALDYLRTPPGAPWRWEDGGRALVWQDGATVAFREELDAIFERLAPGGLPPFPVLVCVLAACRGRYPVFPKPPQASGGDPKQLVLSGLGGVISQRSEQVAMEQLRKLAALPSDVIGNPRGKALLAQIIFEARENRPDGADAARVLNGLRARLGATELNPAQAGADDGGIDLVATFHLAAQPLRGHTAESLRMRLRTGLDAAPTTDAVTLDLPRSERARRLLAKLARDEEHGGLALIARDLMAAIRLPNVLARADEQAAGGASGLGNRGTLDRLLLSELAHDDLTLATRVALNEALYLHREPPERRPRRDLALLIDTGLRMWGMPRALAAATGLALLAGWPDEAGAAVWRAADGKLAPVDLLDEKELTAHLAVLGLALHPGGALPEFSARAEATSGRDVVIVTHRLAAQMEEFRRRLAEVEAERGFLVLVDHAGLVQLHALPWGGEKARPLAEAKVDLDKLTPVKRSGAAKTKAPPLVNPAVSLDLPAIFREQLFPLLLPVTGKLEQTTHAGEGGLCVTSDRRLFSWNRAAHGARQVMADLPGGRTCLLHKNSPGGQVTVVRGRDGSGKMAVIGVAHEAAKPEITRLVGPHHPAGVYIDRTAILLVLHTRVAAVALDASSLLGETPMPDWLNSIGGRYAVGSEDLWFASWDGAQVRWDKTDMGRHLKPVEILCAFERDGAGPWVVTHDGRMLNPAGVEWMRLGFLPALVVAVLRKGDTLLIQPASKDAARHLVHLPTRMSRPVPANRSAADPGTLLPPPTRQLHCRIDAIHAAPGQPLRLRNAKGRWLELFAQRDGLRLVMASGAPQVLNREALKFEKVAAPVSLGCVLRRVMWPGGSTAWMDDRGLLHLRSANAEVPEFTLVLGVGIALAGWASDGMMWGPEFFIGKKEGAPTTAAFGLVERFSNSLC